MTLPLTFHFHLRDWAAPKNSKTNRQKGRRVDRKLAIWGPTCCTCKDNQWGFFHTKKFNNTKPKKKESYLKNDQNEELKRPILTI